MIDMGKRLNKNNLGKRTSRKQAAKVRRRLGDDPAKWNAYLSSIGLGTRLSNSAKYPRGNPRRKTK